MTKNEIQVLIDTKIAGQGTNVDAGGALPLILNAILDNQEHTILEPKFANAGRYDCACLKAIYEAYQRGTVFDIILKNFWETSDDVEYPIALLYLTLSYVALNTDGYLTIDYDNVIPTPEILNVLEKIQVATEQKDTVPIIDIRLVGTAPIVSYLVTSNEGNDIYLSVNGYRVTGYSEESHLVRWGFSTTAATDEDVMLTEEDMDALVGVRIYASN